jgi:hypothetical protein
MKTPITLKTIRTQIELSKMVGNSLQQTLFIWNEYCPKLVARIYSKIVIKPSKPLFT